MQPYDKIEKNCRYGEYDLSKKAAYTITNDKELFEPWHYILQNRKGISKNISFCGAI